MNPRRCQSPCLHHKSTGEGINYRTPEQYVSTRAQAEMDDTPFPLHWVLVLLIHCGSPASCSSPLHPSGYRGQNSRAHCCYCRFLSSPLIWGCKVPLGSFITLLKGWWRRGGVRGNDWCVGGWEVAVVRY